MGATALSLAATTFAVVAPTAQAAPPPPTQAVAILAADLSEYILDVKGKLAASGAFASVTTLPEAGCSASTPSLATLQAYDAVFVWTDCTFTDPDAVGDVLADYVDGGGRLSVATFGFTSGFVDIRGRLLSGGYLPLTTGSLTSGTRESLVANLPGDPLLNGVNSFNGGDSSYRNTGITTTPGSTLVASWTDGEPLVAYRGEVVALNFFPPSSDARSDFWDVTTDGVQLMVNALRTANTQQVITPNVPAPAIAGIGETYDATATGGASGNPVILSIDPATTGFGTLKPACTIDSAGIVTFALNGSCVINANQAAGNGYDAAPQLQRTITVARATKLAITSKPNPTKSGSIIGTTYRPLATSESKAPITFAIDPASAGVCTSAGPATAPTVTFIAPGVCTIKASQPASGAYAPGSAVQNITVS